MKFVAGGKRIEVRFEARTSPSARLLMEELKAYEALPEDSAADLPIVYTESPQEFPEIARNPSGHIEHPDGYTAVLLHSTVTYRRVEGRPQVVFSYRKATTNLVHKLGWMQFTHPWEEVGQIFHEAVLAPALLHFFAHEIALVHGSSLVDAQGRGIVFTGSGGVGKTTLELELIRNRGFKFLADDISILDAQGTLHANYNFPKIYAYNVLSKPGLKEDLFKRRSAADRAWWGVQTALLRPDSVRRRADVDTFYGPARIARTAPLHRMFLLLRSRTPEVRIRNVEPDLMASMNTEMIRTEFPSVANHLAWHRYNRLALESAGNEGCFDFDRIMSDMQRAQEQALRLACGCAVVHLPMSYDNARLCRELPEVLLKV